MTYYTDKEILRKALTALESCSGAPHWEELQPAVTAIKQALAAQPTVQEPDLSSLKPATQEAIKGWLADGTFVERAIGAMEAQERENMRLEKLVAAQPAIPDAITDNSESPEYRAGWNDCREVMAEMLKGKP